MREASIGGRGAGASVFLCRRSHCKNDPPTHPSSIDPPTFLLHYDITLCRPSQPRLVGSDERVSQLVPRSHVIQGDVAASAVGWAGALHSLIRRLKGGGEGMSVSMCLRLYIVCVFVCACVLCSYGRKPSKHGSQAKHFAYRHKAPDTTRGRPRQCNRGQIGPSGREPRWRRDRQHCMTTV